MKMARSGGTIVCLLIMITDIVAGILGIEFEIAQYKGKHLRVLIFDCKEPIHQAYKLGLAAAGLLALAHAIANLLGGCTCICSKEEFDRSSSNRQMAAATLILSWIILAIGFTMLMVGAMLNSQSSIMRITMPPLPFYWGDPMLHSWAVLCGLLCFFHGHLVGRRKEEPK